MSYKAVAFLALVVSCAVGAHVQTATPITCGALWAPDTTEEALRRYFGPSQVSRQMIATLAKESWRTARSSIPIHHGSGFSCCGRIQ